MQHHANDLRHRHLTARGSKADTNAPTPQVWREHHTGSLRNLAYSAPAVEGSAAGTALVDARGVAPLLFRAV